MTHLTNVSSISLDDYIRERHQMFVDILQSAKKNKHISQNSYDILMMQTIEAEDWDEAFDRLEAFGQEVERVIQNHEYYIMLERLEKGEQMIEKEKDEAKKAEYQALYDSLSKEFEGMSLT